MMDSLPLDIKGNMALQMQSLHSEYSDDKSIKQLSYFSILHLCCYKSTRVIT